MRAAAGPSPFRGWAFVIKAASCMERFFKTVGKIGVLLLWLCSGVVWAQTSLETRAAQLSPETKLGDRLGRLHFLGMLELPDISQNGVRLSQLSGLAWDEDDGILYAISDKGALFHLRPQFKDKVLTGISLLKAVPLRELKSDKPLKRLVQDFEGLNILNGRDGRKGNAELVVSTEGIPQVLRFNVDGQMTGNYPMIAPLNNRKNYRNTNKMLESVCISPTHGVITAPETPLNGEQEHYTRLFSLSGPSWLYPLDSGNRITDIECRNQNEVLVLQQNFLHGFGQITVMLKRVRLTPVPVSGPLAPETIFTLDSQSGFQLDNFEGLAHHRGGRFFMVSDNNDLFIQRTLLMYFELTDP